MCGYSSLSICNVSDGSCKALINEKMSARRPGIQGAFAKTEDYGISVHFANKVIDKDGSGQGLI